MYNYSEENMNQQLLEKYGYKIPVHELSEEADIVFEEPMKKTKKTKSHPLPPGEQINISSIIANKPSNKIVREFIGSQLQCVINEDDLF